MFNLTGGDPRRDRFSGCESMRDISDNPQTLPRTAAIVSEMDLVITVDTMIAHLAGALGKPTWLMLPYHACWRWLENRDDSPWYPTMKLFRQERPGDWVGVIDRVRRELISKVELSKEKPRQLVAAGASQDLQC